MMTFGVTVQLVIAETAYQLAIDHCAALGGFVDQSGLGENWAHGRFRAPYFVTLLVQRIYSRYDGDGS